MKCRSPFCVNGQSISDARWERKYIHSLFMCFFFFLNGRSTSPLNVFSSLVIKTFKMLTSTPNAHNLIFRFYGWRLRRCENEVFSFSLLSFYHVVFLSICVLVSPLSLFLTKIIQACNSCMLIELNAIMITHFNE